VKRLVKRNDFATARASETASFTLAKHRSSNLQLLPATTSIINMFNIAKHVSLSAFGLVKQHRNSGLLISGAYNATSALINVGKAAHLVAQDFNTSPDQSRAPSATSSPSVSRKNSSNALIVPDEQLASISASRAASTTNSPSLSRQSSSIKVIKVKNASIVLSDNELLRGVAQVDASYEHSGGIISGIEASEDGAVVQAFKQAPMISKEVLQAKNPAKALLQQEATKRKEAAEARKKAEASGGSMQRTTSMSSAGKRSPRSSQPTSPRAIKPELHRTMSGTRYVILSLYIYVCM
jgi:hypothetical protein